LPVKIIFYNIQANLFIFNKLSYLLPQLIDLIVIANVNQNDILLLNNKLQGDSVGQINRNRMQSLQTATQGMQAKRGMEWIGL